MNVRLALKKVFSPKRVMIAVDSVAVTAVPIYRKRIQNSRNKAALKIAFAAHNSVNSTVYGSLTVNWKLYTITH